MLGTKWPSITSTWIQSAPAWSTARTSSPSLAKSAARIDGAMASGRVMRFSDRVRLPCRCHSGNVAEFEAALVCAPYLEQAESTLRIDPGPQDSKANDG